jgi:rod shape determining protein RodA
MSHPLIFSIFVLLSLGLLQIYSLSPSLSDGYFIFQKQSIFIISGLFLVLIMSFLDYKFLKDKSGLILFLYIFSLLLLVTLFFLGTSIGGAKSWFKIGVFSLEPVEVAKVILILLLAKFFTLRHVDIFLARNLLVSFFYFILPFILVILQPDMGSAIVLACIWLGMVVVAGIKKQHLVVFLIFGIILFLIGWFFLIQDYQKARLLSYLNPRQDPLGQGYNIIQSLAAISSGGFLGKGLGQGSVVQLGFLPARHTDFIFSAIIEEMGFLGGFVVLLAYILLLLCLTKIAIKTRDNFGRLLVTGVLILFVSQIFINIGMNIGFLPITGLPLPLISYGGSGMLTNMFLLGIVLNIERQRRRSIL